jgi:hypothetical protein
MRTDRRGVSDAVFEFNFGGVRANRGLVSETRPADKFAFIVYFCAELPRTNPSSLNGTKSGGLNASQSNASSSMEVVSILKSINFPVKTIGEGSERGSGDVVLQEEMGGTFGGDLMSVLDEVRDDGGWDLPLDICSSEQLQLLEQQLPDQHTCSGTMFLGHLPEESSAQVEERHDYPENLLDTALLQESVSRDKEGDQDNHTIFNFLQCCPQLRTDEGDTDGDKTKGEEIVHREDIVYQAIEEDDEERGEEGEGTQNGAARSGSRREAESDTARAGSEDEIHLHENMGTQYGCPSQPAGLRLTWVRLLVTAVTCICAVVSVLVIQRHNSLAPPPSPPVTPAVPVSLSCKALPNTWAHGTKSKDHTTNHTGGFWVNSENECGRACFGDSECASWNFHQASKHCWLYRAFRKGVGVQTTKERLGYTYGARCNGNYTLQCEARVLDQTWVVSNATHTHPAGKLTVGSQDQCVRACMADTECVAWNYHPNTGAKYVKGFGRRWGHCWIHGAPFKKLHQPGRINYTFSTRCITFPPLESGAPNETKVERSGELQPQAGPWLTNQTISE